jgi:hypothetical protein
MARFGRCLWIRQREESIHENSVVFARTSQVWKFHVDNQILLPFDFPNVAQPQIKSTTHRFINTLIS